MTKRPIYHTKDSYAQRGWLQIHLDRIAGPRSLGYLEKAKPDSIPSWVKPETRRYYFSILNRKLEGLD